MNYTSACTPSNPSPADKPMSISAITASIYPPSPTTTPSSSYRRHPYHSRHCLSPPMSLKEPTFISSPPSSPHSYSSGSSMAPNQTTPLTLEERRLRNKAASAKYRQKKNQQQGEMQRMINQLSEHNAILERQLHELRTENERLRSTADRLRGMMVAKKMFQQWMNRQRKDSFGAQPFPPSQMAASLYQDDDEHHLDFDTDDEGLLGR